MVLDDHNKRLDEECQQLLVDIRRIGAEGESTCTFGELFDDDDVQQYYEALVGTLKSAKKRGLVQFKGQMLLKGMSDKVVISIVGDPEKPLATAKKEEDKKDVPEAASPPPSKEEEEMVEAPDEPPAVVVNDVDKDASMEEEPAVLAEEAPVVEESTPTATAEAEESAESPAVIDNVVDKDASMEEESAEVAEEAPVVEESTPTTTADAEESAVAMEGGEEATPVVKEAAEKTDDVVAGQEQPVAPLGE